MATEVELLQKKIIQMLEEEVSRLKMEVEALKNPPLRWPPITNPSMPEVLRPFVTWETTSSSDTIKLNDKK